MVCFGDICFVFGFVWCFVWYVFLNPIDCWVSEWMDLKEVKWIIMAITYLYILFLPFISNN